MMYYVTEWSNINNGLKNKIPIGYKQLNSKYHIDKIRLMSINYNYQETAIININNLPKNDLNYYTFKIPKKTGGFREIFKPSPELKEILLIIKGLFESMSIPVSDEAYAYVKGRSTFMCRQNHADNKSKWFLGLDIEDFFGACNPNLVLTELSNLNPICFYDNDRKNQLLDLVRSYCFLNNGLPQGSPLSPLLSNMVFIRYDYEIKQYLKKISLLKYNSTPFVYTRYADDIEISSQVKFDYLEIVEGIRKILNPFKLKDKKTQFGNNNVVGVWSLGLLYNNANEFSLGKKNINDVEHDILNMITCQVEGVRYDINEAQKSLGNINYLRNINNSQVDNILNKYKRRYGFDAISFLKESMK